MPSYASRSGWLYLSSLSSQLHVLIDQNRIPVGIHRHETGRARGGLIRLGHQLHASGLQLPLYLPDVGEGDRHLLQAPLKCRSP